MSPVVSLDSHHVFAASDKLGMWDLLTGKEVQIFQGHVGSVNVCKVTPDGRYLLSGGWDATLRLWDVTTGLPICTWIADAPISNCAISPDARSCVACDESGKMHWLNLENLMMRKHPVE